jgi:Uma2 family endonuclease
MSTQTASYVEAIEHLPKGAILRLPQVGWEDYEQLLAELGDDYHVRVSYACGWLEIMSPLPEHEEFADVVLGITREITRELGVKLETRGSMTIRRAWQAKGVEPDTCFYVQNAARIIGKRSRDFDTDPPPDIVVEIDLTNASQSKFPIYAALGVPEIWRYDGHQAYFYHLAGEQYIEMSYSRAFPFLTSTVLAQFIGQSKSEGQDAALDAARAWVRVNKTTGSR